MEESMVDYRVKWFALFVSVICVCSFALITGCAPDDNEDQTFFEAGQIQITGQSGPFAVGDMDTLSYTVLDQNGNEMLYADLFWKSSNTSVATVSSGVVTMVGSGTATITGQIAEFKPDPNASVSVTVQ
jgi:uncharacterized protein YjdB